MAMLFQPDGSHSVVEPKNGQDFSLEELKEFMNGAWIEVVTLVYGSIRMVVDEDGKRKELAINEQATHLYNETHRIPDIIVGPALICNWEEIE